MIPRPTITPRDLCATLSIDPDEIITMFTMEDVALVLLRDTEYDLESIKKMILTSDADALRNALLETSGWSDIFISVILRDGLFN